MDGLKSFGEYMLEIVFVTLLVALSVLSVVLFIPVMVGLNGYFKNKKDVRLFRDIFKTIKENYKIIILFTIFELLIIVFPTLNIYFFNTNPEKMNYFILAVSYVSLFAGAIYFVTAPTIIVNMNVTFRQLLYNGFMLLFGSLLRSLICIVVVGGVVFLILYSPYAIIATLYLVPFVITKMMLENFYVLKSKVLHISVYELKNRELKDDYLDETGMIRREEENGGQNEEN